MYMDYYNDIFERNVVYIWKSIWNTVSLYKNFQVFPDSPSPPPPPPPKKNNQTITMTSWTDRSKDDEGTFQICFQLKGLRDGFSFGIVYEFVSLENVAGIEICEAVNVELTRLVSEFLLFDLHDFLRNGKEVKQFINAVNQIDINFFKYTWSLYRLYTS